MSFCWQATQLEKSVVFFSTLKCMLVQTNISFHAIFNSVLSIMRLKSAIKYGHKINNKLPRLKPKY